MWRSPQSRCFPGIFASFRQIYPEVVFTLNLGDHSFENLAAKEFISYQKSSLTLRNWFKYHFNRFSIGLNRVMTVDSHQAVINGILNHLGMGVIAAHIVGNAIEKGEIIPVPTAKKDVINKISLVQLQDKVPSLTEKTFIRFLKADIKDSDWSVKFFDQF